MPKYVIERDIPGAGNMSANDLSGASAKSATTGRRRDSDRSSIGPDLSRTVYGIYHHVLAAGRREHAIPKSSVRQKCRSDDRTVN